MVKWLFNPFTIATVIKHNFTGAHLAFNVYLPKNGCARPVACRADVIFGSQFARLFLAKHNSQKANEIVVLVSPQAILHQAVRQGVKRLLYVPSWIMQQVWEL